VVESIRSPAEVSALRRFFGKRFFLVAINAPVGLRFKRFSRTPRGKEFSSLAEFKAAERKQLAGGRENQAITKAMALADFSIMNSGTRAQLEKKAGALALRLTRGA
jgi:dephospho-CoA kinase